MMTNKIFLLACCLFFASHANAQNWDINTLKKINGIDNRFVTGYSKVFAKSVPYLAVGVPVAMGVYALIGKNNKLLKDAVYVGTSVIEAAVITYGVKFAVGRTRPYDRYPELIHPVDPPSSSSFPSAHTAAAFSLATSLCITYPKWYVIAPSALWACSVGFARMNQGVHYPTDVLGGAVIGAGCAVANIYINRWLDRLIFPKEKPALVAY